MCLIGIEPMTYRLGGGCSILLSYKHKTLPHLISIESFLNYVNDFLGPITISEDGNKAAIGFDAINIHIARSNHEINVGLRNVDPMS